MRLHSSASQAATNEGSAIDIRSGAGAAKYHQIELLHYAKRREITISGVGNTGDEQLTDKNQQQSVFTHYLLSTPGKLATSLVVAHKSSARLIRKHE